MTFSGSFQNKRSPVHDIVTEHQIIKQVYCAVHSGFVIQKLVQIAVSCLYCTSNPPWMTTKNLYGYEWYLSLGAFSCQKHLSCEFWYEFNSYIRSRAFWNTFYPIMSCVPKVAPKSFLGFPRVLPNCPNLFPEFEAFRRWVIHGCIPSESHSTYLFFEQHGLY